MAILQDGSGITEDTMTDRVSDDELTMLIEKWSDPVQALEEGMLELPALVELRDRRLAEKAPCPEHAKMVADGA